jgi:hypothetical protein
MSTALTLIIAGKVVVGGETAVWVDGTIQPLDAGVIAVPEFLNFSVNKTVALALWLLTKSITINNNLK